MSTDTGAPITLSPDDAFSLLGNETRIEILRALGEADRPLSFTELRDQVGIRQGGQFNYHLDKLVGHFVRKNEEGYSLRRSSSRVIKAVLSGAVTEDPTIEPTQIDVPCTYCEAPVEVTYAQEMLEYYCTECAGAYRWKERESTIKGKPGHLGGAPLPPAGVIGRSPEEAHQAAMSWGHLQIMGRSAGTCPACSAAMEQWWTVCEDHETGEDICPTCEQRFATQYHTRCTNCIEDGHGIFVNGLIANTEVLAFLTGHGINFFEPLSNQWAAFDFDEDVRSTDPIQVRFTLAVDDDTLTLQVDERPDGFELRTISDTSSN